MIAHFDGPFSVWSYSVGHGRLLLRRTKSDIYSTRLDVLFKNVGAICMPMTFDSLSITECSIEGAHDLIQQSGTRIADRRFFAVSGNGWEGKVIAGAVVWHEDDKEYHEPSALWE